MQSIEDIIISNLRIGKTQSQISEILKSSGIKPNSLSMIEKKLMSIRKQYNANTMVQLISILTKNTPIDLKGCNHHHEISKDHTIVNFGDCQFVANNEAIPLLKALNEAGLCTRTHHYTGDGDSFISILLTKDIQVSIKQVNEVDSTRTKYNGQTELLIQWNK